MQRLKNLTSTKGKKTGYYTNTVNIFSLNPGYKLHQILMFVSKKTPNNAVIYSTKFNCFKHSWRQPEKFVQSSFVTSQYCFVLSEDEQIMRLRCLITMNVPFCCYCRLFLSTALQKFATLNQALYILFC